MEPPEAAPVHGVPGRPAHAPVERPADRLAPITPRLPHRRCAALRHHVGLPVPHAAPVGALPEPDQGHALVRRGVPALRGLVPVELPARQGPSRRGGSRPAVRSSSARAARTTCSIRRCPARIAQHLPEVKLIAVLRDPVARAWSAVQPRVPAVSRVALVRSRPGRRRGPPRRRRRGPAEWADIGTSPTSTTRTSRGVATRSSSSGSGPTSTATAAWCCTPRTSSATRRRVMQRVHDFLGHPGPRDAEHRPVERLGQQAELEPHLQARLAAAFEESDTWLAEHLEEPPPWRR